jgi:putative transposase
MEAGFAAESLKCEVGSVDDGGLIPPSSPPTKKALARADLLKHYADALSSAGRGGKLAARKDFISAYNAKVLLPLIYEILGPVSWRTLDRWKSRRDAAGTADDPPDHADRRGAWKRGMGALTDDQKNILICCAQHPNAVRVSEAIRIAHSVMASRGIENGLCERTCRRFLLEWKSRNFGKWVFSREGKAAWNDQCALYLERDPEKIEVGDILVADGHRLNFEIVNPYTGKPKRMTLVGWLDMRSNFLLGWDITPNEDTAAIASSLRRAILRLGKVPRLAYMDNGKAFGSRFFNGEDLSQCGFSGLFGRLGIETVFAWPYHGQSKTIERFFGTFSELERLAPSYTGASIETKPAHLKRGEPVHARQHEMLTGGHVPTLEQAHRAIGSWLDAYHNRPQSGAYLPDKTPMEAFEAGRGPGIDPLALLYLMLADSTRTIGRNGIAFNGRHYWNEALCDRRHAVTIRYDLQDDSAIYVFDERGEYVCCARPLEKLHPAAHHLGTEDDRQTLDTYIRLRKEQERRDSSFSRRFVEESVLPEVRLQMKRIGFDPAEIGAEAAEERSAKARRPPDLSDDERAEKKRLDAAIEAEREACKLVERTEAERAAAAIVQMRESMGIGIRRQDCEPRAEIERETALDDGPKMWRALPELPEDMRYEKLAEIEARDILIPQQWRAFMRYFEHTEQFERNRDRYDEIRFKAGAAARDNREGRL